MDHSKSLTRARSSSSDAAVDGLLNSAVGGIAMAIYFLISGVLTGVDLVATLSAFDLGQGESPVSGALIHLAVAAIYGIVFGLIFRLIDRRRPIERVGAMIMGVTFSLVLWLITQVALAAGIPVALSSLPAVHLAAAHLVYGATLGWLAGRTQGE